MKRVILTGGTGFVGTNLTRRLINEGHEVHLLLRQSYNPWRIESILKEINIHIIDLSNPTSLLEVIDNIQPDWVFHLAAYGAYSSQVNLQQMIETNLTSTANLVNVCLKVGFEAFINTGSSSEYGFKDHPPKENEWIDPNSPYAVTKAAATQYCRFIAQSQKANLATVRLYSVYGPYEEPTRLIPTLIVQGLQGKLPPLVNPNISRDYVYVDDISDAYITLASNPPTTFGEVFNLGTGIQLTLKEVVEVARQHLFVNEEPSWGSMPDRQWDTSVWISDHSKITNDFKWKPINSFSGGFFKTVQWFISHTKLLTFYKDQSEVPK